MKFVINRLKLGDQVSAEIIEVISANCFIVNFNGDLVRVENKSERKLKSGEQIVLRVSSVKPLGFQLLSASFPAKLNLTI